MVLAMGCYHGMKICHERPEYQGNSTRDSPGDARIACGHLNAGPMFSICVASNMCAQLKEPAPTTPA